MTSPQDPLLDFADPHFFSRPWTVVFYSFRGGVGRTTLAVNAAANMCGPESPVFLLDFDLEAPGLDEFELLRPERDDQPGLIEYVAEYRRQNLIAPDLRPFVYRVGPRRGLPACSAEKAPGYRDYNIHVMRAGRRDQAYRLSLGRMDWDRFYREEDGELFFENLRAGALKELGCDLMIVDSRTGLSDIGGICTGFLADAVVLVFEPRTCHQRGLQDVVRAIRHREKREGRPIPRLYVASKIGPGDEGRQSESQRKLALEICARCEGGDVFELPERHGELVDYLYLLVDEFDHYKLENAYLLCTDFRDRVREGHRPDAFLMSRPQCEPDPFGLSTEHIDVGSFAWQIYALDCWVRGTRRLIRERVLWSSMLAPRVREWCTRGLDLLDEATLMQFIKDLCNINSELPRTAGGSLPDSWRSPYFQVVLNFEQALCQSMREALPESFPAEQRERLLSLVEAFRAAIPGFDKNSVPAGDREKLLSIIELLVRGALRD